MGNLCQTDNQPKNSIVWQQKADVPFHFFANTPLVIKQNIVLLPRDDTSTCLMSYQCQAQTWSQKEITWSQKQMHSFEGNVSICKSHDEKTLYIYEEYTNKRLWTIDHNNMVNQSVYVGIETSDSLIFQDSTKKKYVHLIGNDNNHYIVNTETGDKEKLDDFSHALYKARKARPNIEMNLRGAAIIHLTSKKISILMIGSIPLHIWDHTSNTSRWTETDISTPFEVNNDFGYVVTKDDRYVVIMGGTDKNYHVTDSIHLFDTIKMEFIKLKGKSPNQGKSNAAITNTGDIHLFGGGRKDHYVINIFDMLKDEWIMEMGVSLAVHINKTYTDYKEEKEIEYESKEKEN